MYSRIFSEQKYSDLQTFISKVTLYLQSSMYIYWGQMQIFFPLRTTVIDSTAELIGQQNSKLNSLVLLFSLFATPLIANWPQLLFRKLNELKINSPITRITMYVLIHRQQRLSLKGSIVIFMFLLKYNVLTIFC